MSEATTYDPSEALAKKDISSILVSMETKTAVKVPTVNPVQFFREVVSELKKVTWPSREETMKLTAVVIALSIIVGIFIGGLDAILVQAQKMIIK